MRAHHFGKWTLAWLGALAVASGVTAAIATARTAAAPVNTAAPSVTGQAREGSTLTTSNGTWTNTPTSFTYKWQRCASDGTGCGDISKATQQTYTLVSGDVGHTVRAVVTAANADGKTSAPSAPTDVVASKNGPTNTVKPVISGRAQVGYQLVVSTGTWTPTPTSFTYQWQRCDVDGSGCRNISATGRTYSPRNADVGHRMRALVTAHIGTERATAESSTSPVVVGNTTTTVVTTTNTTTVRGNQPPSLRFISLTHVGARVYARFRVCDDGLGTITVVERDVKSRVISATRRFRVVRTSSCGVFRRSWIPAKRFRTPGRYVVTLRAIDTSRALSRLVSRSLVWH